MSWNLSLGTQRIAVQILRSTSYESQSFHAKLFAVGQPSLTANMSSPTRSASWTGSYESLDHESEHDENSTANTNAVNGADGPSSYQKPKPYSDQKHINGKGGPKQKRPTHFLCFPLVTDESVPQLAKSLQRFRELTTAIPAKQTNGLKAVGDGRDTPEPYDARLDIGVESLQAVNGKSTAAGNLKVIPAAAHRPPGTFHLTIGAMDLSQKSDMQKAVRLLKSIDFEATLRSLESYTRPSTNGHTETTIAIDASRPETSNSSSSTLNANQTPKKPTQQTNLYGQAGYRETVSRVDRAILRATPDSPSMRQQKSAAATNGHTITSPQPSTAANDDKFKPNNFGKTSHLADNTNANLYGVSGYKETVSTVDRYVDKTYAKAQRVKQMVQLKKGPLKSLRRDVSPPRSLASTTNQRLLSVVSKHGSGDGGSLYTTMTGDSAGTARPSVTSPTEASDATKATAPAQPLSQLTPSATRTAAKQYTKPPPFFVTLQGISAFSSPRKARVFYAPPQDPSGKLLAFANAIRQLFKDEGLINEERELTLHATLANMTYVSNAKLGRVGGRGGKGRRKGRAETVDGAEICRFFNGEAGVEGRGGEIGEGEMMWARDIRVDRARICKMGAERSEDPVLGMVYRAVEVAVDDEGDGVEEKEKAEVVFA